MGPNYPPQSSLRRLLAQHLSTSRGGGRFANLGPQPQQYTSPYLQNPNTTNALGVVNAASPSDPYSGSTDQGTPALPPSATGPADMNAGGDPIMGPSPQMLPSIQAGTGTFGSGTGSGFYGVGSNPPPVQNAILRQIQQQQPQSPYLPYGGSNYGGPLRF